MTQAIAQYTKAQALQSLMSQPELRTSVSALARQWGWDGAAGRMRAKRLLDDLIKQGRLSRTFTTGGRSIIRIGTMNVQVNVESEHARTATTNLISQGANLNQSADGELLVRAHNGIDHRRRLPALAGAMTLAGLAGAVAWLSLRINARYGAALGTTPDAGSLMAELVVLADLVGTFMPATAGALWRYRNRPGAAAAWLMWGCAMMVVVLAAIGFPSQNISDATAVRDQTVSEAKALTTRIDRLQAERSAITESRPVAALMAAIQAAQSAAAGVWHATSGCTDVTRAHSGEQCATVQTLRQAHAMAERRDAIDAELATAQAATARLPAIAVGDPQAVMTAGLMNWASRGLIRATPSDIAMLRVLGMVLLQLSPGVLLMLAAGVWRAA